MSNLSACRLLILLLLCSCASENELYEMQRKNPRINIEKKRDPFKALNTKVTKFNIALDKYMLRNIAIAYKYGVNNKLRDCVSNCLHNLRMPCSSLFHLMCLNGKDATNGIWRFIINSTIGICGLFNPAGKLLKLEHKEISLCNVLENYGWVGKPYIVLPVIGSSSPRDIVGFVGGIFLDPLYYVYPTWFRFGQKPIEVINDRSNNFDAVDSVLYNSIDTYTTLRDMYLKKTDEEIAFELLIE